ncbi:MAG: hypothetical protein JW950_05320 [Deltaproteobacteria bacterium]|nr:hypothetical protein [Deltaproteobacteria bacterium]
MEQTLKRALRHFFGWFFIILGIIGLFLPFLQGILFIVIGVGILTPEIPLFHKITVRLEARYPEIFKRAHRLKQRFVAFCKGG